MIVETYQGCKIRAVKGKGWDWGRTHITLNDVRQGTFEGDEARAIASVKASIDHANQTGPAQARYGAEWYTPGTYEIGACGHPRPVGGTCGHHYCVRRAAAPAGGAR